LHVFGLFWLINNDLTKFGAKLHKNVHINHRLPLFFDEDSKKTGKRKSPASRFTAMSVHLVILVSPDFPDGYVVLR